MGEGGYPIEMHILFIPQYMKDICLSMFCDVFHNVATKIDSNALKAIKGI